MLWRKHKTLFAKLNNNKKLQVSAENQVINESWDANGNSYNLADTIGIMVYEGATSLDWVKSYTNGPDQGAGKCIQNIQARLNY